PLAGRRRRLDQAARGDDLAAALYDRGAGIRLRRQPGLWQADLDLVGLDHLDRQRLLGRQQHLVAPAIDHGERAAGAAGRERARELLGAEVVRRGDVLREVRADRGGVGQLVDADQAALEDV